LLEEKWNTHFEPDAVRAAHAGLAVSRCLAERSIDHVVLERGEVANSWRRERWDSFSLLTPNFLSRLPGHGYAGDDPDGFMTGAEVVAFVSGYAEATGELRCRCVVLASGACNRPSVPDVAAALSPALASVTPMDYRNPDELPDGGVLVVGASATSVQLADEIHRSGRPVTLSVGEHVRLPRTYRGRDVLWWMEASGVWDERYDQIDDIDRARGLPSPQLVRTPGRATLDLNALMACGIEVVGRLSMIRGRPGALLRRPAQPVRAGRPEDAPPAEHVRRVGGDAWQWRRRRSAGRAPRADARAGEVALAARPRERRDQARSRRFCGPPGSARTLDVPVLDAKGRLRHDGGVVTGAPGMYALGLPVLRRRKSTFIHGAEDDARDVVEHMAGYLARSVSDPDAVPR
jgi:putative flavoprotein involved in K+ transport